MRYFLILLAAAFLAACGNQPKAETTAAVKAPDPIAIQTASAETRKVEKFIQVTGELTADETVAMRFEVGGRVAKVAVDFGQVVRKGDLLAEMEQTEYRLQLERAKAMLAQSLARIGLDPSQANAKPTTSPAIRQAEAQLADAKSKYDSAAKLIASGDISKERFTELDKAMQARQAVLDAARDDLRVQVANVGSLRAEVQLAEKHLGDTVLRAPFDGAITERLVSPGQFIKDMENTPILRMVKADPLRLRADIPEVATSTVHPGSILTFTTDAAPGQTFNATVRELNPSLDAKSRTMTVEARISNPTWKLRPGTFVQVKLVTARDVEIVTVPKKALYSVAGLSKVFAIRDGKVAEFKVPPGLEGDTWVEVPTGGITAGDKVAITNIAALIQGSPVKVN